MLNRASKATRREWIALSVLTLPALVYLTDITALEIALPKISASLQPSGAQLLWLADIYGFMMAAFLITMGTLGDRIGRRKLLLLGASGFILISCLSSISDRVELLILMRGLLGIAAATLAPSTMSLLRNMFHHDGERQFAIGVWIASISCGGVLGPFVGGLVLRFFPWNSVFLIPVPPMLLVLMLGPWLLPEYRDRNAGRLDLTSSAMSLASLLPAIQALKLIAEDGFGVWPLAMLAAGVAFGIGLLRRQAQLTYPLVDLSLLRQPRFTSAVIAYGLSCFAMFGLYLLIAQYLQVVLGLSPWQAGLATVPCAIASAVGSMAAPSLANWFETRLVLAGGLVTAMVGIAMLDISIGRFGLAGVVAGTVVFSLGLASVFTPAYESIITCAPPERSGAAAAIAETASELSGAMGIALLGSLATAVYRHLLFTSLPEGLPPAVAEKAAATIGGANAIAAVLPAAAGGPLLASARAAFSTALQVASLTAGVAIAVAWCAVIRQGRQGAKDSQSAS